MLGALEGHLPQKKPAWEWGWGSRTVTRASDPLDPGSPIPSWLPAVTKASSWWHLPLLIKSHLPTAEGVDIQNALWQPNHWSGLPSRTRALSIWDKRADPVPPIIVPNSVIGPTALEVLVWICHLQRQAQICHILAFVPFSRHHQGSCYHPPLL